MTLSSHFWLGAFYFWFFAAVGAMTPYWTLYLANRGLGAGEIGALVALMAVTKVVAPNFWGWLADVRLGRLRTIRVAALCAALAFAGLFLPGGLAWVAVVVGFYGFFMQGVLPQFEALTLGQLAGRASAYSKLRVWGSIGFIVTVVGAGAVLDLTGPGQVPALVLPLLFLTFFCCLPLTEPVPKAELPPTVSGGGFAPLPAIAAFLVAGSLMALAHGPFYAFFSIYLVDAGYAGPLVGALWALGVVAEIIVFMAMQGLIRRFGLRSLFIFCFVAGAVRWVLVAKLVAFPAWIAVSQVLHAATFGIFHAASVQIVQQLFGPRHLGRGQGLYSSLGAGLGGGLGALLSGFAWEHLGSTATWLGASIASVAGGLIAYLWLPRDLPGGVKAGR